MPAKPSLIMRIAVGKTVGLIIGLAGFVSLPWFLPDAGWLLRWGVLLWYTTIGGIIGLFGVLDWHPVLKMPLPWWVRGPFVGAWMNFVLAFFAYDTFAVALSTTFGEWGARLSPFTFALEGAIVGLIIGFCATRLGGEGKETVGR